jgi:hypothetical protein
MELFKTIYYFLLAAVAALISCAYIVQIQHDFGDKKIEIGLTFGCRFSYEVAGHVFDEWNCMNTDDPLVGIFKNRHFYSTVTQFVLAIAAIGLTVAEMGMFFCQNKFEWAKGFVRGIVFILLSISVLGCSLDLGIAAGFIGIIAGIIEILFGCVSSLSSKIG